MTESQHRFLREITARVPAERIVELRLFPVLRQGRLESGVAVLATEAMATSPPEEASGPEVATAGDAARSAEPPAELPPVPPERPPARITTPNRFSILTAHYRLTLKGPDRGKWEFALVHDADAPLEALEPVVRGVARRVGEAGEPELLSGPEVQRAVSEPWWTATA